MKRGKVIGGIVGGVILLAMIVVAYKAYTIRQAAIRWEGPVEEILSEKLDIEGNTLQMKFTSRVDFPVHDVFQAFREPERLREFAENVRLSRLVRSEDNRKVVEIHAKTLGQLQAFTLGFTFFPQENRVVVDTVESSSLDLAGEYRLTPSPDGTKTLVEYQATLKDKRNLPFPQDVRKGAARESFVDTVRALKKRLAAAKG